MNVACIVTGDRHARAETWNPVILGALHELRPDTNHITLIHGDQATWRTSTGEYVGIDYLASKVFADQWPKYPIEPFPADWATYGKGAGPIRNEAMLKRLLELKNAGYYAGVLAFHDDLEHSKGTGHMVRIARAAKLIVLPFTSKSVQP